MATISIIVPIYNAEKFIERCIQSVLQQTFTQWELILIDDGSKDNSFEICQQFAKKERRIHIFHQNNSGANKARLNGINKSKGKYLMFLDADDFLPESSLSILFTEIEKGFDFVRGNLSIVDDYGVCPKQEHYKIEKGEYHKLFKYTEFLLCNEIAPYLCGAIYKRDFFYETDFMETINLNLKIGEDYLTLLYASVRCKDFELTNQTVYYYYQNSNSVMNGSVLGRETSHKIDLSIERLLINNNVNKSLMAIAIEKTIKGMILKQFTPELKFSWTEYKTISNYIRSADKYKGIMSLGQKYIRFIKHPLLFYIYTRIFCFLLFLKKRKCRRYRIV